MAVEGEVDVDGDEGEDVVLAVCVELADEEAGTAKICWVSWGTLELGL